MTTLRTLWKNDPGLAVSGGVHVGLLVFLMVGFVFPPHLEEPTEAIAVEMISTSDMNKVMNGEETAKLLPKPQRRVDRIAEMDERRPTPPVAEAKRDTPPPPSPEKANDDPGQDEKKTEAVATKPPPPAPMPPERPVVKAEIPKPAPRDVPKPPPRPEQASPPDAEALAPKPPPRPKTEPKETKDEAKPEKLAKVVPPPPPRRPDPPKKPEPKPDFDQVAKLLDSMKPPKPATKVRAGNEAREQVRNDFSLDKISQILDHEAPQHRGSTGKQLTQLASLGSATSHSDTMSVTLKSQIDGWLIDHYLGCWHYFGTDADHDYVPKVRVLLAQDGSLIAKPILLNPPTNGGLRSLADSTLRAVKECDPLPIPNWLKPHYDAWRDRTINFDLKDKT